MGPSTTTGPEKTAERILPAIAAYGLDGARPLPQDPLDQQEFAEVLHRCERHRLVGLFAAAVSAGDFELSGAQRDALETALRRWCAHALRLERLLLRAHDCLRAANVEHRVVKGIALAHTVYDEPSWRVFGDVDLVVESSAFPGAAEIIAAGLGAERMNPERRAGYDARFGSAVELRCGRLEVDVHRTLVYGALGLTVRNEELLAEPRSFTLAGRELRTLAAPQQLIHACYAAVLSDWPPRLSALRDVAQVHEGLRPDPDATLRVAGHWRAKAVVARGLSHAWDELHLPGNPPLVDWARNYKPRRLERILVASYHGQGRGYARQIIAPLVIPGIGAKMAFTQGLVFPQRAFLEGRQLRWKSFARSALERMRLGGWFDR